MDRRGFLFLTGATGHTGSRLARRLIEEGWAIRCLVRTAGHATFLPKSERLEVVPGTLDEPGPWRERVAGAEAFVHLAHVGFAPQVIEVCTGASVGRVVAISSTRRFTRFPERTARLVMAGEAALEASALDYTILRPTMIFGGDRDNNLEKITRWLARGRPMPLVAGGRNLLQPIFVWDLVDAIVRALARPEQTRRRALIVAGLNPLSQRELTEAIAQALGRRVRWIPVPLALMMMAAWLTELAGEAIGRKPFLARTQVRRLLEDKVFPIDEAREALGGWSPRPFEEAITLKVAGKA